MAASALTVVAATGLLVGTASGFPNDVQWDGVSHLPQQDLRPVVPMRGEAFAVRFQTLAGDVTEAAVLVDAAGGTTTRVEAEVILTRGPYDLWQASVPSIDAGVLRYQIELTDGSDTDYFGAAGMSNAPSGAGQFTIDHATLSHIPGGSTPVTGGAVFRVWSPGGGQAYVAGEFNGFSLDNPMTRLGEDWVAFVPGAEAGDEYRYWFENGPGVLKPDPRAKRLEPRRSYNSVIVDPTDYVDHQLSPFSPVPREQMVVMQIHVGTFAGLNDPAGSFSRIGGYLDVGRRADYLAELGVNAVMFNPINEFPGEQSGGYNPMSAFAVETVHGSPGHLKFMVDELHQRGIASILDVVWNHFDGGPTNWLWNYNGSQIWYDTPVVDTPWGPQADLDRPAVRDYFIDSAVFMLDEVGFDGFRHDAVFEMLFAQQGGPGRQVYEDLHALMNRRYADKLSIAEIYNDQAFIQAPLEQGGIGFSASYQNEFKEALRSAVFDAAFGDPDVGRVLNVVDGQSGEFRQGRYMLNYFELHDDIWDLNGTQRAVKTIDPSWPHDSIYARGRTKLAYGVLFTSRGIPAFAYGSEWLEDHSFESQKIDWSHLETYADNVRYFKDLIALRTKEPALFADSGFLPLHRNESGNVIAYERYVLGGKSYVAIANFSNTDYTSYRIGLPRGGSWGVAVNSELEIYGGTAEAPAGTFEASGLDFDGRDWSVELPLPARGFVLLEHEPAAAPCNAADVARTDGSFGTLNGDDISTFVAGFVAGDLAVADVATTGGSFGTLDGNDISGFVSAFLSGCP